MTGIAMESAEQAGAARSAWAMFREDVNCVFDRDPAARNRLEVYTTYPGVHAILLYRFANRLWLRGWRYLPRLISYIGRIWTSIDIHPGATIGSRFFIDHGVGVVIGETALVGDDVTLYHGVTLGGTTWSKVKRHPTVGDGVVIGAGAKVLGPLTLGAGVRVGANSVVIRDVADGRTVIGIPAKVVKRKIDRHSVPLSPTEHQNLDLDHHLIPDPVAAAMTCLLDRIRLLEQQTGVHGCIPGGTEADDECPSCDAREVCDDNSDNQSKQCA